MKLTRWKLLKKLWVVRELGIAALLVAMPTVGVGLTFLGAAVPIFIAELLGVIESVSTLVVVLAIAMWFVSAAAVGVMALRGMQALWNARTSGGEVTVGRDGIAWRRWFETHFARWSEVESVTRNGEFIAVEFMNGTERRFMAADLAGLGAAAEEALAAYEAQSNAGSIASLERGTVLHCSPN